MKENVISLSQDISNNAVVYFSEPVVVTKKTLISVPGGYKAYGYIDEKLSVRIEPCINMNIYKEYGKSMLGKTIRVAYILNKALPQMLWGVGNINVSNERLKEAWDRRQRQIYGRNNRLCGCAALHRKTDYRYYDEEKPYP